MKRTLSYVISYVLWLANSAMGLLVFVFARDAILDTYVAFRLNPWAMASVDKFVMILLGIAWLAFIVACEIFYRRGVEEGKLLRRFAVVTGIESLLLGAAYLTQALI